MKHNVIDFVCRPPCQDSETDHDSEDDGTKDQDEEKKDAMV